MPNFLEMDDGIKIRYEEKGSGKPVILIHGWTGGIGNWMKQVPELSKYYKVITYAHRGHGESDKPEKHMNLNWLARDLNTIIKKLKLEKPVAVGHSMGAATLFEYLKVYGDSGFSGICFIDMTPKFMCSDDWNLGIGGAMNCELSLLLLEQLFTDAQDNVEASVIMGYHRDKKLEDLDKKEVEILVQMSLNTSLLATTGLFVSLCKNDYRDVLPKIKVPVLLAYGGGSQLFPSGVSEYMKKNIKNSKLVIFEKSGHNILYEEPEKLNKQLKEFIQSV
ncbi:MAG: alpha/beta fold hydrolase [Candidatus Jordarchaeum sp.]|uniref:alpha/beta fold hydrolase n=1 Tax=Candidatus Jordarchaeum sp. TaxID=2823881 RepID=UPI00404A988A